MMKKRKAPPTRYMGQQMNKPKNSANNQEMEHRLASSMHVQGQAVKAINDRMGKIEDSIHNSYIRAEAFYEAVLRKNLISKDELEECITFVRDSVMEAAEAMYDLTHGLEAVDKPIDSSTDLAIIVFQVKNTEDKMIIEKDARLQMMANPEVYQVTQLKEVAASLMGKKTGDKASLSFSIPESEPQNQFAGMSVLLDYEVLKVKVQKPNEEEPTEEEPTEDGQKTEPDGLLA